MNILIIEDEKLILKSMEIAFKRKSHNVSTTALGKEAIKMIQDQDFDLIITDLMLNDINGFDILEASMKKYSRDEIKEKFIIMTAYSSEQIVQRAKEYGCLFIRKPFESLNNTIEMIQNKVNS